MGAQVRDPAQLWEVAVLWKGKFPPGTSRFQVQGTTNSHLPWAVLASLESLHELQKMGRYEQLEERGRRRSPHTLLVEGTSLGPSWGFEDIYQSPLSFLFPL